MTAVVDFISIMRRCMNSWVPCPQCGRDDRHWLRTDNEYDMYCPDCEIRYTDKGEIFKG